MLRPRESGWISSPRMQGKPRSARSSVRGVSKMEYRRLGKAGLKVSALSFGSWVTFANQVDVDKAVDCMAAAYDAGCNFFDNAEAYAQGQSEIVMGKALKKLGWR